MIFIGIWKPEIAGYAYYALSARLKSFIQLSGHDLLHLSRNTAQYEKWEVETLEKIVLVSAFRTLHSLSVTKFGLKQNSFDGSHLFRFFTKKLRHITFSLRGVPQSTV